MQPRVERLRVAELVPVDRQAISAALGKPARSREPEGIHDVGAGDAGVGQPAGGAPQVRSRVERGQLPVGFLEHQLVVRVRVREAEQLVKKGHLRGRAELPAAGCAEQRKPRGPAPLAVGGFQRREPLESGSCRHVLRQHTRRQPVRSLRRPRLYNAAHATGQPDLGGGSPCLRRARPRHHRRRPRRPRGDDVREDEAPAAARRRPAQAHASRAARLPRGELQPDPAADAARGRRRLCDHGAGRVPADVRHEHDLRYDGAARDRDGPDAGALHGPGAGGAGGARRRARALRRRQSDQCHVPQRAGVRRASGPGRRSAATGHRDGRRRVGRDVLRHRRRGRLRSAPHAGRGPRHRAHRRDDQGRHAGAAPGRPSREPGDRRRQHCAALRAAAQPRSPPAQRRHRVDGKARLGPARHLDRRPRPVAVRHRDVGEDGGAAREGPAWPPRGFPPRRCPRHGLHRTARRRGESRALCRRRAHHHRPRLDHRVRPGTCSIPRTRSPKGSPWAISGARRGTDGIRLAHPGV